MAISAVAGIASAIGGAIAANVGALTFSAVMGTLFTSVGAAYFLLGAGLSMVSRALAPKPNLGAQLRGITQTTRDPAGARQIVYGQMRVGGQIVFIGNSGDDNTYLHLVIVFASHEIESFEEFWFNDNRVYDNGAVLTDWQDVVTVTTFDGSQTAADGTLTSQFVQWTDNHVLNDMAYAHFKLKWDQDKFPQGVPNITAILKGKKVYDPREGGHSATNPATWTYSQNPALCARDYLVDNKYGLGEDHTLIDETALTAAANLCDEDVALDGGGTQDRYTCNGVLNTENQIKSNIEQVLSAMGGRLSYSGGKYFIDAAGYVAPTFEFNEADCVSDIQTQTKQSRRGVYNGVKGIFVSEEKNYKVLDYPAQISSTYEAEDGDPIYLDMPLPFVTNNTQAQRLAKIALLKSRQQVVVTMTVNLKGLQVKVGDTIKLTNERLGYDEKIFEVIDYSLAITAGGNLAVNVQLIETAAAIYDWTTSDEADFLSGGVLDLYDGRTVNNVTSLAKSEIGLLGPDGSVLTTVELTWTAPDDAFIDFYKIRYNKQGTTEYFHAETKEPRILLSGLDVTSNYDFRVRVQNLLGVTSTGTTLSNQQLDGDTTAPSPVTNVEITSGLKNLTVEWTNPTDADFAYVQIYVASSITKPASPVAQINGTEFVYPAASGEGKDTIKYFWLEAVDFSGNVSTTVGPQYESIQIPRSDEIDGDVSELFPSSYYQNMTLTNTNQQTAVFTLPAPDLGNSKRAKVDQTFEYTFYNSGTSAQTYIVFFSMQLKSKSATGEQVGATNGVYHVSYPYQYNQLVYLVGNHLGALDNTGKVGRDSSGAGLGQINGVYYDGYLNRTYVLVSQISTVFSTGDTMFYSPSGFTSVGTYYAPSATDVIRVNVPANTTVSYRHHINETFGPTTTATDFRAQMRTSVSYSNTTIKLKKWFGTLELIA